MCASFSLTSPDYYLTPIHLLMVARTITASQGWTTAQILTPILVAIFLCLTFILYILYKRGSLPGLVPTLPFMRSVRRVRRHREWEVDGDAGDLHHAPDAEATPMISQPHPWNSFFPRNATDRQHSNSRIKEGMVAPALTSAIRSIQRLFGRGPIAVSRVPVPDTFDLESSDSETDPFDTLRSNSSRAKLNPSANSKHNVASGSDRGASSYTLSNRSDGTRESSALDAEFDDDPGFDLGVVNGVGGSNDADDHDSAVIMIGQDYSSSGGTLSLRGGRSVVEADQSSLEVVPPTPTLDRRVSTFNTALIRTRWLTIITLSAFSRERLPREKCFHTSFSLPLLRLSPNTPVLPFNRRAVKR